MKSIFLESIHHAYAQTDGSYNFPNSREGDMLKQAKKEIETLETDLKMSRTFYSLVVKERDLAHMQLGKC